MEKGIKRKNSKDSSSELDSNKQKKSKSDNNEETKEELRILEFFCGIGGMHYAFEQSGMKGTVVASFDINVNTNSCYQHNFNIKPVTTIIDSLKVEKIQSYKANCWLMSPPCQPYTRGGKKLDDEDRRAAGLLNLINILPKLDNPPKYIFVENVVNFEVSRSREKLIKQLDEMGYEMNEHLVTPTQFGIPNDRARYYLSARLPLKEKAVRGKYLESERFYREPNFINKIEESELPPLSDYREDLTKEEESKYSVPDEYILKRYKFRFDIVKPDENKCSCFTKAYGSHHVIGTGSFLQTEKFDKKYDFDNPETLLDLGLRFFSPNEVALLHAFPIKYEFLNKSKDSRAPDYSTISKHTFSFPETMTQIQRYKALGNSLNVHVVAMLLKHVLFNYDNKDFQ
ncbi:S-adenosyl-L-methionine-dependent methyltransferase [Piromyces finnis]|uniref:tRNA (cytosine(38)-C(5))-methyltransferase n=1 Tax=Piromyces finnis TaxID=1754191 RepID=A0A1Y1V5T5_9FUNG|nr:S-adenosyl-L-methionine-dependent methyltransferase [Piromyces finnis]|eukprot:ORX47916.1 S-adenosyl-L-methionine-dependent methyltransferase [Piromyces finnis]